MRIVLIASKAAFATKVGFGLIVLKNSEIQTSGFLGKSLSY